MLILCLSISVSLISCGKNSEDSDNSGAQAEGESQIVASENNNPVTASLDSQLTPIQDVEMISDEEIVDSIIKDVTKTGDMEPSEENKGVSLILKHDGKLKEVPFRYPLVNWISEQDKPVLIEFVADYSEPSTKSLPYLNGIAEKYTDDMFVCKVDVKENFQFVDTFELEYLPTYYVSKNLTLYNVAVGFDPYANPSLIDNIDKVINE